MAKLVIGEAVPDGEQWAFQVVNSLTVIRQTSKVFTYADENGDTISFNGKNLKYDGEQFAGGRVFEIIARSPQNEVYGHVTGLDLRAADMFTTYPPGPSSIRESALAGNDVIRGSTGDDLIYAGFGNDRILGGKGNDRLNGLEGNDILTGRAGSDVFAFNLIGYFGNDRVTDFNPEMDELNLPSADFLKIKDGKDTILGFEDGSRIRLEGIKPVEFTEDHYYVTY